MCPLAAAARNFARGDLKRMDKKKMPAKKRVQVPTQKMKDLQSSPPPNEQSGCFAFVRWENGYTCKIFTGSDILTRDEAPVQLQDLRSRNPILAKWSDGKFYRAILWTPCDGCKGEVERILRNQRRIDEVISRKAYVLRYATLPGWEQIEEAKLKKAFINKCRARTASKE